MVLILDNNNNRSFGLCAALNFIGETTLQINETQLIDECVKNQAQECIVILGALQQLDHEEVIKQNPTIPFLLIGETLKPLLAVANVVGLICEPFNHEVTTQLLHDCQQYQRMLPHEHKHTKPHKVFDGLVGETEAVKGVRFLIEQVSKTDANVLILGESGTGKEVVARNVHLLSKRNKGPFVPVNCGAIPAELLESELFGHESGAFTGASKRHEGRFERANSGTLFLDELANTSALVQEKLLRVIEYGEFERVGGKQTVKVDTRLVCATNEDLPHLAQQGEFRSDLLDRLAFDVITLPPLRERQDDIMLLAEQFAMNMARDLEWELFSGFTRNAQESLLSYEWPGNVRELKNVVERSLYRHGNEHIPVHKIILDPFESRFRPKARIKHTQAPVAVQNEVVNTQPTEAPVTPSLSNAEPEFPCDLKTLSNEFEITLIKKALEHSQFNQKKTAEVLGLTYHQLRGYLKKYNLLE